MSEGDDNSSTSSNDSLYSPPIRNLLDLLRPVATGSASLEQTPASESLLTFQTSMKTWEESKGQPGFDPTKILEDMCQVLEKV